jgi:hypothetical protein
LYVFEVLDIFLQGKWGILCTSDVGHPD